MARCRGGRYCWPVGALCATFVLGASGTARGARAPLGRVQGGATIVLQEGAGGYRGTADVSLSGNPRNRAEWGTNSGGGKMLTSGNRGLGNDASRDLRRLLLRFDLPSSLKRARIVSATLELYCPTFGGVPQSGSSRVACYVVKRAWGEGRGGEAAARTGEASWTYASRPRKWERPGCDGPSDRIQKPLSITDVSADKSWFAWDVTAAVRGWVSGKTKNQGLLLRQVRETTRGFRVFHSSEADEIGLRPKLVVTYVIGGARASLFKADFADEDGDPMRWTMGKIGEFRPSPG